MRISLTKDYLLQGYNNPEQCGVCLTNAVFALIVSSDLLMAEVRTMETKDHKSIRNFMFNVKDDPYVEYIQPLVPLITPGDLLREKFIRTSQGRTNPPTTFGVAGDYYLLRSYLHTVCGNNRTRPTPPGNRVESCYIEIQNEKVKNGPFTAWEIILKDLFGSRQLTEERFKFEEFKGATYFNEIDFLSLFWREDHVFLLNYKRMNLNFLHMMNLPITQQLTNYIEKNNLIPKHIAINSMALRTKEIHPLTYKIFFECLEQLDAFPNYVKAFACPSLQIVIDKRAEKLPLHFNPENLRHNFMYKREHLFYKVAGISFLSLDTERNHISVAEILKHYMGRNINWYDPEVRRCEADMFTYFMDYIRNVRRRLDLAGLAQRLEENLSKKQTKKMFNIFIVLLLINYQLNFVANQQMPILCKEPPKVMGNLYISRTFRQQIQGDDRLHSGSYLEFKCKPGYKLGNLKDDLDLVRFTCSQEDGSWKSDVTEWPLFCKEDKSNVYYGLPKICNDYQNVTEAYLINRHTVRLATESTTTMRAGSIIVWRCYYGYYMEGSSKMECQKDGTWTTAPKCEEYPNCDNPSQMQIDGMRPTEIYSVWNSVRTKRVTGTYVTFVCANSNSPSLENGGKMMCTNGKYEPDFRKGNPCLMEEPIKTMDDLYPVCDDIPEIENSFRNVHGSIIRGDSRLRFGSKIYYQCRNGFEIVGIANLTCNNAGEWTPSFPKCAEKSMCEPLENVKVQNAVVVDGKQYRLNGRGNMSADGSFVQFKCSNGDSNPLPHNGIVICRDAAYFPADYKAWSCLDLSPNRICDELPDIEFGVKRTKMNRNEEDDENTMRTGSVVEIICQPGYEIEGPTKLECNAEGTWNPLNFPSCNRMRDCESPENLPLTNSYVTLVFKRRTEEEPDRMLDGSYVRLQCYDKEVNELPLNGTVTCNNGEFDRSKIEAIEKICPKRKIQRTYVQKVCDDLPSPSNTIRRGSIVRGTDDADDVFRSGTIFVFYCERLYQKVKGSNMTCDEEGHWQGTETVCEKRPICDDPEELKWDNEVVRRTKIYSFYLDEEKTVLGDGTYVEFECRNRRRQLPNNGKVICIDGKYKPPMEEITC
ncbi:hypothetical protein SNEBB_006111 [Seison nebaliae]|nr:hypothetical protein SNEBB_006111 [Seison nebaliae]